MNLYEITTGVTGMSYERCYVWAPDEDAANAMYDAEYGFAFERTDTKFLFSSDADPFVTKLNTEGWEV